MGTWCEQRESPLRGSFQRRACDAFAESCERRVPRLRASFLLVRVPLPPKMLTGVRQRIGRLVPFAEPGSFARMAQLSGVERFHVHMLRHTFAAPHVVATRLLSPHVCLRLCGPWR